MKKDTFKMVWGKHKCSRCIRQDIAIISVITCVDGAELLFCLSCIKKEMDEITLIEERYKSHWKNKKRRVDYTEYYLKPYEEFRKRNAKFFVEIEL